MAQNLISSDIRLFLGIESVIYLLINVELLCEKQGLLEDHWVVFVVSLLCTTQQSRLILQDLNRCGSILLIEDVVDGACFHLLVLARVDR